MVMSSVELLKLYLNVTFNNTSELLKAVEYLKQVTMEQIAIMEPKEIHIMFNGFAGDFFKKLYLYGSIRCYLWNQFMAFNCLGNNRRD